MEEKKKRNKRPNGRLNAIAKRTGLSRDTVIGALRTPPQGALGAVCLVRSVDAELDKSIFTTNRDFVVNLAEILTRLKEERRRQKKNLEGTKWAVGYIQVAEANDLLDYVQQELQKLISTSMLQNNHNSLEAEAPNSSDELNHTSVNEILQ